MSGSTKFLVVSIVVAAAAGLFAIGCQSSGNGNGDASATHDMTVAGATTVPADAGGQAVACDTCKVTWVKTPVTNSKGRVLAYTTTKSHECPDCRGAVENFFATGKLQHDCPTCGKDALQVCDAHVSK